MTIFKFSLIWFSRGTSLYKRDLPYWFDSVFLGLRLLQLDALGIFLYSTWIRAVSIFLLLKAYPPYIERINKANQL